MYLLPELGKRRQVDLCMFKIRQVYRVRPPSQNKTKTTHAWVNHKPKGVWNTYYSWLVNSHSIKVPPKYHIYRNKCYLVLIKEDDSEP